MNLSEYMNLLTGFSNAKLFQMVLSEIKKSRKILLYIAIEYFTQDYLKWSHIKGTC